MNIAKVSKTADFVNYVKPGLEMVEMETENSLLLTASGGGNNSFTTDPNANPDAGKVAGGGGLPEGPGGLRSSRPKIRR
jgi:hypothetical protein